MDDPTLNETTPLAEPSQRFILVVDDDEHVRSILETLIHMEGFQVATAVDGIEGLAAIEKRAPDLIVSDLMMSRQGGYEFLRELSARGIRAPVIVVTGSKLDDSTVNMIKQEGNVVDFARKPLSMAGFMLTLHKHLGTKPPPIQRSRGLNDRQR